MYIHLFTAYLLKCAFRRHLDSPTPTASLLSTASCCLTVHVYLVHVHILVDMMFTQFQSVSTALSESLIPGMGCMGDLVVKALTINRNIPKLCPARDLFVYHSPSLSPLISCHHYIQLSDRGINCPKMKKKFQIQGCLFTPITKKTKNALLNSPLKMIVHSAAINSSSFLQYKPHKHIPKFHNKRNK